VSAGVFTFLLTVVMSSVFTTYLALPVLSLPFVAGSSIAYLASLRYSNLLLAAPHGNALLSIDLGLPVWLAGFFRSFGAILFSPSVIVGLLFCLTVLYVSRILFLMSAMGYYVGACVRALMLGSVPQAFGDLNNFNFILIAMAVGGVFLVPSLGSYALAAVAVVVSTMFLDSITVFWAAYGIPVFTLPFNVISLGLIYALGRMSYPKVAARIGLTPEETLEDYLALQRRYPGDLRTLSLPFAGKWTVWQGFDGRWTHKGSWRHAYDFVISDERGKTHMGDGARVDDYYCYRKPVLAPVRGRVVRVVDDLPDNPVGTVDKSNNWGNLVVIEDPRGFCVEISHLARGSIHVTEGAWVARGAVLGLCGNSGYSPQPHIHVQAQLGDVVGAATVPFSFTSFSAGSDHHANDLPEEGSRVSPLCPDKRLENLTSFVLDQRQQYAVLRKGEEIDRLALTTRMASDGTFYFESERGRLYFGQHEGTFYFYRVEGRDPWLPLLFLALPRMPLAHQDGLVWRDHVPVGLATSGWRRLLLRLLSAFWPALVDVRTRQRFLGLRRVETVIELDLIGLKERAEVELDAVRGFARIRMNGLELRRDDDEDV